MATPSIPRTTATKSRTPSTVRRIDVSPQVMERERTSRYKQLKSSAQAFIDTRLPNGEREILTVIGRGVIERDIIWQFPDKSQELILYCGGGYRSALAADNLRKMGYTNILSMKGGWTAWKEGMRDKG